MLDAIELNPGGKDIFTDLVPMLIDVYEFKTFPERGGDFSQGMKFVGGEFVKEDGTVLALNATIFSDGVAAETFSNTKDSDAALTEMFGRLLEIGFSYDPEMIRRKAYVSQLNIKCSGSLTSLNRGLSGFAAALSSATGTTFDLSAMEFWPPQDQTFKPANFSFQRKTGEPHDSDRYWSQASLPTDEHLKLLEQFETLLTIPQD
jgi:hypothetical protein